MRHRDPKTFGMVKGAIQKLSRDRIVFESKKEKIIELLPEICPSVF